MSKLAIIEGPNILLAKMPTAYKFRASEVFAYYANVAKVNIAFQASYSPSHGETLILKLGKETISILFEAGYIGSDWSKIRPSGDFATLDEWISYFKDCLENIPYINRYYKVSNSGTYIGTGTSIYVILEAREAGDYNILIDAATTMNYVNTDTTFTHETEDLGNKQSLKMITNLNLYKDIHHNLKDEFIDNICSYCTPDKMTNTGIFSLNDLPKIISANLEYDIPNQYEKAFLYRKNHLFFSLKNYLSNHVAVGVDDRAIGILEYEASLIKNDIIAINGSLPIKDSNYDKHFEKNNLSVAPYSWIYDSFPTKTKFLTFQDRRVIIDKNMPQWLSFIIEKDNINTLNLEIICYDNTGAYNVSTITIRESNIKNGIICIPTGYYQLDIDNRLANTIKYTVQVENESELFTYIIDPTVYKYTKYFVYLNAFSCIECIRFTGVAEYQIKKESANYKTILERDSNMNNGTFEMIHTEMEELITIRTGFINDRISLEHYKEIITSPYIAEVIEPKYWANSTFENIPENIPTQSRLRKMILIGDTFDFLKENDFTYGLEFKLKPAHNDLSWSNINHRYEPHLDNEIEIDIYVSAVDQIINWSDSESIFLKVFINNEYVDDVEYTFKKIGKHSLKIKAHDLTVLNLLGDGASIHFLNIDSFSLNKIVLNGFAMMIDRYLTNRVKYLQNLIHLEIDGIGYIFIDDLLLNLQILRDKFNVLNYIKILGMPSTPIQTNVSNYFTSLGMTIIL